MMIMVLFSFCITEGGVFWIYITEVVVDSSMGFVIGGYKTAALLISLSTEYLMDSVL